MHQLPSTVGPIALHVLLACLLQHAMNIEVCGCFGALYLPCTVLDPNLTVRSRSYRLYCNCMLIVC